MANYSTSGFKWIGYGTYTDRVDIQIQDDDDNISRLSGDSSSQDVTIDGVGYDLSGGGYIETIFTDSETGTSVTENLLFINAPGYGWTMVPPTGSSFSAGDTVTQLTRWVQQGDVKYEEALCFTPGARILTSRGALPAGALRPGDRIQTVDNGYQTLRWIGQTRFNPETVTQRPILLISGSLGAGLPTRDLWVSPQHRIRITGAGLQLCFGESEVFAPARAFGDSAPPDLPVAPVYLHLMLDRHEVIFANGIATESFFPGPQALSGLSPRTRQDLLAAFPSLDVDPDGYGPTARSCLTLKEAQSLKIPKPQRLFA